MTIAAKRTEAAWRSERQIPQDAWRPAIGMDAEVAPCDYVPAGWLPGTRTNVRRVKVRRDELSADTRSRRRRTIDPNQLVLLEAGEAVVAYACSFIVTNLVDDICQIYEGTNQIQRAVIAKKLLG